MRLLLTILTLSSISCFAQVKEYNPFESIGKPGKIVTLSNGKYTEVHINDSLQRIGSVIVNMNSGKIYEVLQTDTLYNESNLDPTIITRWYSLDPIAKPHESPYASMANNPIWCTDPDGADSAKASGSNVWQWNVETGDTYNEISQRTGVSVDNLRAWNGYADKGIPTTARSGVLLHISDPNAPPPATAAPVTIAGEGSITIPLYSPFTVAGEGANLWAGEIFTPLNECSDETYIWYQTVGSNDPLSVSKPMNGTSAIYDRSLVSEMEFVEDGTVGMKNSNKYKGQRLYPVGTTWSTSGSQVGHMDKPSRACLTSGDIKWQAQLCLYRKSGDSYVKIATFFYSYSMNGDEIIPGPFRFNPDLQKTDGNTYHEATFNAWDQSH